VEGDYEVPIECCQVLTAALEGLLERIVRGLAERQRGLTRLECRLALTDGPPLGLSVGLFRPSHCLRHVMELLRLRLERLALPAAVSAARLEATAIEPLAYRQRRLPFARVAGEAADEAETALAWEALVDRLSNRLGRQHVLRARLQRDPQPECACRYEPLIGAAARRPVGTTGPRALRQVTARQRTARRQSAVPPSAALRPLKLLPEPCPLSAVWAIHGGPPGRFVWQGRSYAVRRSWGPERIETGWWRQRTARRDYYRVETATGDWLWLFRLWPEGLWFLHGAFG
jgi:protein ImuB